MKIILFDIDDTLVSCDKVNGKSSEVMFKTVFNIDASEDQINKWGKTEKGIIEEVLSSHGLLNKATEIPNQAFVSWAEATRELFKEIPPKELPGVRDLLNALLQIPDTIIGLLTGNSRIRAEVKLKTVNLDKYFWNKDNVLTGIFGDISSKRSDLISIARKKYGDGKYILVDDSLVAAKAAAENNISSILVATGKASLDELKEYTPYVFVDFGENRWKKVKKIIQNV